MNLSFYLFWNLFYHSQVDYVDSSQPLPAGLSIDSSGRITGTVTAEPTDQTKMTRIYLTGDTDTPQYVTIAFNILPASESGMALAKVEDSDLQKEFGDEAVDPHNLIHNLHSFSAWKDDGNGATHSRTCSYCESTETEPHNWDEGEVTREPTKDANGTILYTCEECGATRTDVLFDEDSKGFPFDDVERGSWYEEAVTWAVSHDPQITNGTSADKFSPGQSCTRAQVVTFLWRSSGCPDPESNFNPFEDVKMGDYYFLPVLWAYQNDITTGTTTTTFSPDDKCTRGQVVTFMNRANGNPKAASAMNPFIDVSSGDYFYDAVLWAVEKEITKGTSATTFSPTLSCTRAEIVTFLFRGSKNT